MKKVKSVVLDHPVLLLIGVLLIASNLRAPIIAVAPILGLIRDSLGLTATEGGLLTTLPLLVFALLSPCATVFAREYGLERSLMAAMVLVAVGVMMRSTGSVAMLYVGTGVIGIGAAFGNVLLPSLLKRDFPTKMVMLTAVYALTMGVASALGSSLIVPIAKFAEGMSFMSDWSFALVSMLIFPLLAIVFWLPQMRNHTAPAKDTASLPHGGKVWHSALAWQVTLFFGLNSFVYYIVAGWLPSILQDAGFSEAHAGVIHGLLQLSTAAPGLLLIPFASKIKDQRFLAFMASTLSLLGVLGLLFMPAQATIWTVMFGFGTGEGIILALSFIGLRTHSLHQAAALSGMSQSLGYLLAATGPILAGSLHHATDSWTLSLWVCALSCALCAMFGLLAGRNKQIS